jgi:hypothetical protein
LRTVSPYTLQAADTQGVAAHERGRTAHWAFFHACSICRGAKVQLALSNACRHTPVTTHSIHDCTHTASHALTCQSH